jgi:hypothetical protein
MIVAILQVLARRGWAAVAGMSRCLGRIVVIASG